jgi:methylmalonyl-CoA epimerase
VRARRIDHIGIAVRSLDAGRFLTEALGFDAEPPVRLPDHGVRVQFFLAGGDKLELLEPTAPDGPLARFLERRGEGLHHVCLEVEDIEEALTQLAAAGVRLVDRHAWRSPHGYAAYLHPQAWHGVSIELRQHVRPVEGDDRRQFKK